MTIFSLFTKTWNIFTGKSPKYIKVAKDWHGDLKYPSGYQLMILNLYWKAEVKLVIVTLVTLIGVLLLLHSPDYELVFHHFHFYH